MTAKSALKSEYDQAQADEARHATEYQTMKAEFEKDPKLTNDNNAFSRLKGAHERLERSRNDAKAASDRYRAALEREANNGGRKLGSGSDAKALSDQLGRGFVASMVEKKALDGTSGGSLVSPFYDASIDSLPTRAMFIRSVVPTIPVSGDKVWYLRQSAATNNAAPVAAGALKPTSLYSVERVEAPVVTIAHVSEALDRSLLMDEDALVDFIGSQLRLGVLLAEEDQMVNGSGTAPQLRGILNTTGIGSQARGTDSNADAIHKAATVVRNAFFEPNAIVLNPANWETIRLSKASGSGDYLAGTIVESDPNRLWGIPVITSPVIASGTGLVGDFTRGARLWDREEPRITFTESGLADAAGQELFTRNQIRFRGEERIAFGVPFPAAFCKVTSLT